MGCCWSPIDSKVQILQKIKSEKSYITPHTSHITYYIGICKFYKIYVINTVLTFNNSSKRILKNFDKYFLMEIITSTVQTAMSGLKIVKPTISRWKKALSEKFGFPWKSWKTKTHIFFSNTIKQNSVLVAHQYDKTKKKISRKKN